MRRLVLGALFLAVMVPVKAQSVAEAVTAAGSQVAAETVSAAAGTEALESAVTEPAAPLDFDMTEAGNVTFDFRDADIRNVLKVLAYKSGVNMIAGPEVVGLVNIQLKDVPWQKALEVILTTYGYSYEQKGKVIMVTTVENLKKRREDAKLLAEQEPVATETFILNYAKAEDVLKTLDKMKTARGSLNYDQRTNAVIVTDVESNVALMRDIVKKIDTVTPQVLIEARIIETALNKQEVLGINWPTNIGADSVTLPSRSHNFPWSTRKDLYLPAMSTTTPAMTYGTISLTDLSATLDILNSRTDTNVLSNPRIVTLDNQSAEIKVGTQYPLPEFSPIGDQGEYAISGWKYMDYGLTFKVTPHINGKGMVSLDIEPNIVDSSSTVAFAFGSKSVDVPVLSSESAKTSVMIKDGETLVIAGLIKDKKTKIKSKVPVLGDIPLLGWLMFRHKDDAIIKTELIIFITPRIITPDIALLDDQLRK